MRNLALRAGYVPVIKADLLRRLGRGDEALLESQRAIAMTRNEAERKFLDAQMRAYRAPAS
jgi:RNA polymerase sigma-70 factor (ECF subfamily)